MTISTGDSYNAGGTSFISGTLQMANETGKRYVCTQCRSEFIVTKGGSGAISCCGQPMEIKR